MVDQSNPFPHVPLKRTTEGVAVPQRGGSRSRNQRTQENISNRQGHGSKLRSTTLSITSSWQEEREKREKESKPELDAQRLILQIDPDAFDPDKLKGYGIEVIAELEDGFIVGASADLHLTELQNKIEKFINEEHGGGSIPEVWEIIDGRKKPELIVSPELWQHWDQVKDNQFCFVDLGIACVGTKAKLADYPKRESYSSDEGYIKAINRWIEKRNFSYQEWDDLKLSREDELESFISDSSYRGEILSIQDADIPIAANLPDSFSCRIKILGKGLKDLVYNFPYVFEVTEPDQVIENFLEQGIPDEQRSSFILKSPQPNAPRICVIDSGIQERHPLLLAAIDSNDSKSWIPGETNQTSDYVSGGGHGTRVAGAVLYPRTIPHSGQQEAICWIQNARVLDKDCKLPRKLFPPNLLDEVVSIYHQQTGTKIFNHSISGSTPCLTRYMSAWAAAIDQLTWHNDILFVVATGNLPPFPYPRKALTRLSIKEHLLQNRVYPDYLLEDSCRIANPAQSLQALTVGSVALITYNSLSHESVSEQDKPSAFSCSGFGIWETIKPEVVEYGGDLLQDKNTPPNFIYHKDICPELVRSTLSGGSRIGSDTGGTSYATPKVTHIAARLAALFPDESCLLYRALIVQSARWPEWAMADDVTKLHVLRQIGYGIPNLERATENSPSRITLTTRGEQRIKARQAHIYQVKLPEQLRSQGDELEFLLEITLSYKAQPKRTRRNRRRYLSTWLDWDCSKRGEDPEHFLARKLKEYDAPANGEKGEDPFKWNFGQRNNWGIIKGASRSAGTLQKDWAIAKSYELRESFGIAVIGHEGWNNDPDADVPYSLVVSFEAIQANVSVYEPVKAEIEVGSQVEQQLEALI